MILEKEDTRAFEAKRGLEIIILIYSIRLCSFNCKLDANSNVAWKLINWSHKKR
jgi:hypothetical protein